jgi:mannitol-1-phosphate 5-dehydrogenase
MQGGLALIVGGGNVGIGVMMRSLRNAGYDIAVVTHHRKQARWLRQRGPQLQLTGDRHDRLRLAPCLAVAASEPRCVTELVRTASLVVVTVAPQQLSETASLLAPGLARRRRPVNVLVCDNRLQAGSRFARDVALVAGDAVAARHGFVGLLLDQVASSGVGEGGSFVHVEANGRMFLDATGLRAEPPVLPGALLVEDHRAYVLRKLYLFSAGHAAGAFLGRLRGHTLMSDALADPVVTHLVRRSLGEARAGLEHRYGARFVGGDAAVHSCLSRYADPDLGDSVTRVARNPDRKLRAEDRICGPAQLALAAGVDTPALALVAAAGLCAHERLQPGFGHRDVDASAGAVLMSGVSGLASEEPFVGAAGAAYAQLTHEGLVAAARTGVDPVLPGPSCNDDGRGAS